MDAIIAGEKFDAKQTKKTFEAKKLKQNEAKNQCLKKQSESKRKN